MTIHALIVSYNNASEEVATATLGQYADANDPRLAAPPYAAEIAAAAHLPTGAHIVDFGFIGDATEPSIVEINPPFSFGTYGCRPETMRAVLETGWRARMTGRTASRDAWFPNMATLNSNLLQETDQ